MSDPLVTPLPRCAPEAQGLSSAALTALIDALEARCQHVHSLMVLRGGQVVTEGWWAPYRAAEPHMLYSLSKSFCSTAAGFAVSEGLISLDDPVLSFFPDEAPAEVSANLAAMKVRHLLCMGTGHSEDTLTHIMRGQEHNWARVFLGCPVTYAPGTFFLYNSGATYMVSAIVQKVTGQKVVDYLRPRLFEPLGIRQPRWDECPRGINTGGWGLNITTEDIARFGQLYLRDGVWEGQRVLPAGWVAEATRRHISNGHDAESDWAQGYGFQFWRCRHNAYRGDGAFGQLCMILPEHDCVIAATAGLGDFQGLLNVFWDHLLPALADDPQSADLAAACRLTGRLAGLVLPAPQGSSRSPLADTVDGASWVLDSNEHGLTRFSLDLNGPRLVMERGEERSPIDFGWDGRWRDGLSRWDTPQLVNVAATGAWTADDTLCIDVCAYNTPATLRLVLRFDGDQVSLAQTMNVSFGPTQWPLVRGRRAGAM